MRDGINIDDRSVVLIRELEHHDEKYNQAGRIALYNIGLKNTEYTREIIKKGPKTGQLYRIPGRKRRHRASAPGQAPANLTGNLRRNVAFVVRGYDQMEFGDKAYYGRWLELGTKKMKARPHLIRAVKETERYAMQEISMQPIRAIQ